MMARRGVIGLIGSGLTALLSGCGLFGGSSYRFRMTVEVETPGGLKTGSSTYEVAAKNLISILPDMADRQWSIKGEAVAVDLPGGKTLFALLKTGAIQGDLAGLSMAALDPAFKNDIVESAQRIARGDGIRSPAEVAPSDYPMLVTFGDIADPASVVQVDPADMAARFGAGVKLRRIVVEVTDEAVSSGIEDRLAWLPEYYSRQFSGDRFQMLKNKSTGLSAFMSSGSFSAGNGLSAHQREE